MKVFLSWSGTRSKAVAEMLSKWIRCVLQAVRPWISSRDIYRGSVWFGEISDQLRETAVGIVCLTQENKLKPWILFEAGALAKGLSSTRVCTFLIDLQPSDIEDPLAQFNHTLPEKESVLALVRTLNSLLEDSRLDEKTLDDVFETYWPSFEKSFEEALEDHPPGNNATPRSAAEVMAEILENTRQLSAAIRRVEMRTSPLRGRGLLTSMLDPPSPSTLEQARRNLAERLLGLEMTEDQMVDIISQSGDMRDRASIIQQLRDLKDSARG